jgi:hypothetical protein
LATILGYLPFSARSAETIHVAPNGDDAARGTAAAPLRTLARARDAIRELKQQKGLPAGGIQVLLHGGTYYLPEPLVLTAEDSGTAESPIRYAAAPGEAVTLSGGSRLDLRWQPYKNGIMRAEVPQVKQGKLDFDQLLLDGRLQHPARYPNFDPHAPNFNGCAADAISPERINRWAHPETAILNALHGSAWGGMHFQITGVDQQGQAILKGGQQNNRPSAPHKTIRFVENVFEELDAPGEWYLDRQGGVLYFLPPEGLDLGKARIEVARLKHLVEIRGSQAKPVRLVTLSGLSFTHARRTFLEQYEPLLRSDWSIYRGGAVLLEGTEDCAISQCNFENLGGNAVFVNRYNRRLAISGCRFTEIGASGVCFVGDAGAVRSATYWDRPPTWSEVDRTPGPKNDNHPADCRVHDCLMFHLGTVEKQIAGVQISMSGRITVSHCSIYDLPRAGINIGEGTFGGHVIEFCDVFDTVKETGDHGSFNSWGRDRYWGMRGRPLEELLREVPDLPKWDAAETTILRNTRWRCDHGWDIDLDDGSTNYHIYNNLCLHGGIKNREGFFRVVENNIMVNNTFHPHCWYPNSRDAFRRNIVMGPYRPAIMNHWDGELDRNFFTAAGALAEVQKKFHTDQNSLAGDPMFVDPPSGDYRVKDDSPALKAGFKNFPMDQFGVVSPRLRAEARTPKLSDQQGPAPVKAY